MRVDRGQLGSENVATSSDRSDARRQAGWLPEQSGLEDWLAGHRERTEADAGQRPLHPAVAEFAQLIESDPVVRMLITRMIDEVPNTKQYSKRHVENVPQLLRLINGVLGTAPEFSQDSMVMLPIGAVLDWSTGTRAGFEAFRDLRINAALGKILKAWCEFLDGPDSRYVLNASPGGWKSPQAREAIGIEQYRHDPDDEYWGFRSWNDFFTRRFHEDARPVAAPDDDSVIVSACESTPYAIRHDVQRTDQFWVKSEPYSLHDLLAGDESVDQFVGGTLYQAFLSALNYHRWHSPVAGTIVRAFPVGGTYYSEADAQGAEAVEPQHSQGYLAHVAARAVIVIEADDPAIGLVAFVPVGMSDVSSCRISDEIAPGHHVAKGDELGHFQYGGSTHCLIFRPGVIASFAADAIPQPHDPSPPLVKVRSHLATAARR
jgi:phosphatidylserine decarboxylase